MEEKDFIMEVLKRLTPNTSWHGETYHDSKSVKNTDILLDMIYYLMEEMVEYSHVTEGNKGNYSFEKIAENKRKCLKIIEDDFFPKQDYIDRLESLLKRVGNGNISEDEAKYWDGVLEGIRLSIEELSKDDGEQK